MCGLIVIVALVLVMVRFVHTYKEIFRLSDKQLAGIQVSERCKSIRTCNLQAGDILIRKYDTERTRLMVTFARTYFTHTAFYLGNDQIVEAVGTEKDTRDDIQIARLSKSDWYNDDLKNFYIIRPLSMKSKMDEIGTRLTDIARDADYTFGFPESGQKKASCADLIYVQLEREGVIGTSTVEIISPDYLFWMASLNKDSFTIVGHM